MARAGGDAGVGKEEREGARAHTRPGPTLSGSSSCSAGRGREIPAASTSRPLGAAQPGDRRRSRSIRCSATGGPGVSAAGESPAPLVSGTCCRHRHCDSHSRLQLPAPPPPPPPLGARVRPRLRPRPARQSGPAPPLTSPPSRARSPAPQVWGRPSSSLSAGWRPRFAQAGAPPSFQRPSGASRSTRGK